MCFDKMNDKIVVINPSKDNLNLNNDQCQQGRFSCTSCNQTFRSRSNLKKYEKKFCKSGSININSKDQRRFANKKAFSICVRTNDKIVVRNPLKDDLN